MWEWEGRPRGPQLVNSVQQGNSLVVAAYLIQIPQRDAGQLATQANITFVLSPVPLES